MKIKLFVIISLISLLFLSCASTDEGEKTEVKSPEPEVEDIVIETVEDETEVEDVIDLIEEEPIIIEEAPEEEEEEYLRSVNDIDNVSREEFNEDKTAILQIIDELSAAMNNNDYDKIKSYISSDSIEYHSNLANLKKIQKKLPNKQIQLKGIRDYLKYVFIPARQNRTIDEIRYVSKSYVKAVEENKSENKTTVYYYFVKEGNKWLVDIPEED